MTCPPRILVLPPRLTASARTLRATALRRGLRIVEATASAVPEGLGSPGWAGWPEGAGQAGSPGDARGTWDTRGAGSAESTGCTGSDGHAVHLHAGPSFADVVAPALGIALLEAPADWLARLPRALTQRDIRAMTIGEAYRLRRPAFVKSPNDKSIPALVYADGSRLPGPDAVDPATVVLVSDVMTFAVEYRLHLLDGAVHAAGQYAEAGRLRLGPPDGDALAFGRDVLAAAGKTLPSAIVVDVGRDDEGRWAVIEANAAWASGCYSADPDRALETVLRAAGPATALSPHDRAFVR
ncbi:ATP-grasp domain-containing protein [Streptomyces anulatus]|uniref:ATP-grasp domain-containing protein n=1 Tax=Streptomyces anulatus TaxID=1892 RepID=UPI002DD9A7B3|nr:ATP-grasp domain-containing protein [Streptomyces anulatus]WSC62014.1 ATP-grasp domain-containing protein [Streptomyces anulatus]WUD90877.1 ATP-grasp domain-containing protein [Streptomyces anulatus]